MLRKNNEQPKKQVAVQYEFGTKEFFLQYVKNQIAKEGKTQEVIYRVHFSMTQLIFETHKGNEAYAMLRNLANACETLSKGNYIG